PRAEPPVYFHHMNCRNVTPAAWEPLRGVGLGSMTYSGMIFSGTLSGHLTKLLGVGALVVIGAAAFVTVISAPDKFGNHGYDSQADQFKTSQNTNRAPTIFVPSTIYAEASEALPFFVKIDPRQSVPPDSVLSIHGLTAAASLSEGRRV